MRRLVAVTLLCAAVAVAGFAPGARAAAPEDRSIVVVDIDGLLDPVTADLIERSLVEAERDAAAALILTIDSSVAVDVDVDALAREVAGASLPVLAWVKGGGAARLGPARLVQAADLTARAGNAALEGAPADLTAPTLRDLIAAADGREVSVAGSMVTLELGEVRGDSGSKQVLPIRFRELGLGAQLQHALTSPFVAYLLLVLGLCLIVFEFFAIGIGLAAAAGALLVVAAFVGFAHLPVDGASLIGVILGVLAISIDVQAGRPRFWATVGAALLTAGSLGLYEETPHLEPPAWQILVVIAGALVFLLPGLAAMIRARFSTPTIGREWMVGEVGTAAAPFTPDGVVTLRGAPWRARATRAADIGTGDPVRVTAIRGLVLEVEPVEAQDGQVSGNPGGERGTRDESL